MAGASVSAVVENGLVRARDGKQCVYYDGYWIRYYAPPEETLANKRRLIHHLARRVFHHTEPGINTPPDRVEEARAAYAAQHDPALRRVNGAMLAGALFNKACEIFDMIVGLAEQGVEVGHDDAVMKQCSAHFREALDLGMRYVKHRSGEEGIDELWGEPFKAFTMTIAHFYETRYIKIAQAMRDIDGVAAGLAGSFADDQAFRGLEPLVAEYARTARQASETMKSDPVIFEVWPRFVAAGEALLAFRPRVSRRCTQGRHREVEHGLALIREGKALMQHLADARVPMPKSTAAFLERCTAYAEKRRARRARSAQIAARRQTRRLAAAAGVAGRPAPR